MPDRIHAHDQPASCKPRLGPTCVHGGRSTSDWGHTCATGGAERHATLLSTARVISQSHRAYGHVTTWRRPKNVGIDDAKPTGRAARPTGRAVKPTGRAAGPTGRPAGPTGRAAKPTGRAAKTAGRAAKPTGRAEKPTRRAAKPTGRGEKPTGRVN